MKSFINTNLNKFKVRCIDIKSREYPPLLKEIKDPPLKIYYRGSWNPDIFKSVLSVVGSRRMTGYGEIVTERLITAAASEKITIVSGFMYGIDAAAHSAALDAQGITAAVMPCGIERIHPRSQEKLYFRILKNRGLVISEFEGDMQPARWSFPRRNRIIAGLSPALLVIEAGLKSGALITASYANRYRRHIFAVPGPITSSVSMGTATLIKQGASLVSSDEDIMNFYGKFSLYSDSASNINQDSISDLICGTNQTGKSELDIKQNSEPDIESNTSQNTITESHTAQQRRTVNKTEKRYDIEIENNSEGSSEKPGSIKNCIIRLLNEEALSVDEIIRKSSKSASETGAEITRLLISKKIILKEGLYYPAADKRGK